MAGQRLVIPITHTLCTLLKCWRSWPRWDLGIASTFPEPLLRLL